MTIPAPHGPRPHAVAAIVFCAALLVVFAIVSYSAVLKKSATYDEPLHAVAGFVHLTTGDFRINPEDPALFGYWGALPHSREELKLNLDSPSWGKMIADTASNQWPFVVDTLYHTPGTDADSFLNESRLMFVIVGVALGALIAIWSWQLAGAAAALIATAFFALDPNFMAHTALVKNDVMLSLAMAGMALALWRFGRRGTWLSLIAIALCCAVAVNVKFSGLLCGPIIFIALIFRALLPQSWIVVGMELNTHRRQLIVAPIVCVFVAIVSFIAIWACYGFRFGPTNDPNVLLNTQRIVLRAKISKLMAANANADQTTQQMIDQEPLGPMVNMVLWAEKERLLPQPWLFGFLYTRATTYYRGCYLLGQIGRTGWWYYFPATMLFKTPSATLMAIPIAIVCALSRKRQATTVFVRFDWWSIVCIGVPPILYGVAAMAANLNLGVRHILPVYPFIFIALSLGLSRLTARWKSMGIFVTTLLLIGLAVESLSAYPNYLAFFNTPSDAHNGIDLLGDSNLDWGQDLPALAAWRKQHLDQPMYLAYFGIADPHYYRIDENDLPVAAGGWPFAKSPQLVRPPCYFAVSATNLQGIYLENQPLQNFYDDMLKHQTPVAVLNKTIYIYQITAP
jgi:Dolichyl-phosphate-mannose-protein mannosyltransferase